MGVEPSGGTSMTIRWRRVAAAAAASMAAVLLAACSSSSEGSGQGSTGSADNSTYTLGVLNSLTGDLGAVGQQEKQGMDLAVDEINAAGGVNGHPLALKYVDDQGSVNLSTAGFKTLATTDKVPVIIGPGISAQAKAVAPLADQYNVTNILLIAQPVVANGTKNVFEIPPPGKSNSEAMVKYAADKGVKSGALIYANNPYGQEGNTDIAAAATAAGISMVSSESWDPAGFDFTAQATKVTSENPDVVFLYGAGGTSDALLLKAVRDAGYKGKVVGDLTYSTSVIPKTAGPAADTVVSLSAVNFGDPNADEKKFLDAYKAKYNADATVLTAYAYAGVNLAAAAIEKAGSMDGAAIAAAVQGLKYESVVGTLAYTADWHGGPQSPDAFKPVSFKDGVYAPPVF
jgi:branched-chain amino acid transport system substrate-binding protein